MGRDYDRQLQRLLDVIYAETPVLKVTEVLPEKIPGSGNAVYIPELKTIAIKSDVVFPQKLYAIAHEAAHAWLEHGEPVSEFDEEVDAWGVAKKLLEKAHIEPGPDFDQRVDFALKEIVDTVIEGMAYSKVQPFYGPEKGRGGGHGRASGDPNSEFPVPRALSTKRGASGFRDEGFQTQEGVVGGPRDVGPTALDGKKIKSGFCDEPDPVEESIKSAFGRVAKASAALALAGSAIAPTSTARYDGQPVKIPAKVYKQQTIAEKIADAEKRHGYPKTLLSAMYFVESRYNPNAVSSVGAKGIAQLRDLAAREVGITDPFDVDQGIEGGALYLKKMLQSKKVRAITDPNPKAQFMKRLRLALMMYNAGPSNSLESLENNSQAVEHADKVINKFKELQNDAAAQKDTLSPDKKTLKEIIDTVINEMGVGAMQGMSPGNMGKGGSRGNSGAWGNYNPRGNFVKDEKDNDEEDDDVEDLNPPTIPAPGAGKELAAALDRSPSTRMLPFKKTQSNPPLPGVNSLDHEKEEDELHQPTDLSNTVHEIIRKISVVK